MRYRCGQLDSELHLEPEISRSPLLLGQAGIVARGSSLGFATPGTPPQPHSVTARPHHTRLLPALLVAGGPWGHRWLCNPAWLGRAGQQQKTPLRS